MGERTKIINDPADLVPLLHVFKNDQRTEVFKAIAEGSTSLENIQDKFGEDGKDVLELLNSIGLVKSKWDIDENGPSRRYQTSYSRFRANFECNICDIIEILNISISSENVLKDEIEKIENLACTENNTISEISKEIDMNEVLVRALAKKCRSMSIEGNKIEAK